MISACQIKEIVEVTKEKSIDLIYKKVKCLCTKSIINENNKRRSEKIVFNKLMDIHDILSINILINKTRQKTNRKIEKLSKVYTLSFYKRRNKK